MCPAFKDGAMPQLHGSRVVRIGAGVIATAMLLIGFLPLFGGPGYESALAAGLLVPGAAAIVTAIDVSRHRPSPLDALGRGVAVGAALASVAYFTTLIHGLRVGFCDLPAGSAFFALGPFCGAMLGGAWGAIAGEVAARVRRRRTAAVLLALSAPVASVVVSVVRFVTSPIIFAYDPFVGFFSGTLYDTIVSYTGLITYRVGTGATLVAATVAALHLRREEEGQIGVHWLGRPGVLVLGAVAFVGSVAVSAWGDALGHWQTAASISEELGATTQGRRCDVVHPRGLPADEARRFVQDCDAHVAAAERWLGAPALVDGQPLRIRAYVFANAEQKGALMGAARTYIAKPWRREVYLQESGYPHPALGHEIMHVMAGAFGRGPLRIAGALGGLLPDPGLIEGIAVAGSPREGDLSASEWAKAMKDLRLLPRLKRLFALGFLAENSSTAYTVSGAFVEWVHERHGAGAVRAWYGGQPLPEITGAPWEAMEREWHDKLDAIVLTDAARVQAQARFDRPAIFGRRCPRVVDACKREAERLQGRGDFVGAREQLEKVITLDGSPTARIDLAELDLAAGERVKGVAALETIAGDEKVPRHLRDRALEMLANAALAAHEGERAALLFGEVASRMVDEDRLRTLDVKVKAAVDARAWAPVVELLIGSRAMDPDAARAAELLGAWAASTPEDGLPSYLLARQRTGGGRLDDAAQRLDLALAASMDLPRVRAEAARLRLVVACGLGDAASATRAFDLYERSGPNPSRLDAARRLLQRCTEN
ncbi:tetratricopeptide repeat protein [Chondromyces apiculatus]|nr:hypothetical protein [Chondromyces apiculatus]